MHVVPPKAAYICIKQFDSIDQTHKMSKLYKLLGLRNKIIIFINSSDISKFKNDMKDVRFTKGLLVILKISNFSLSSQSISSEAFIRLLSTPPPPTHSFFSRQKL